ncbi:TPA: ATP-binding cassette domain-containing protein [Legionella pneumophila]|uniref:ABC transporter ATP-binding protein n=1 Tax=Legionella pneumophila TaxID=446 RepID=UPI0007706FCD|nr:ABC transporter ATP-binding protein [Legionella pneumophila]HAT8919473.1 ATP-binding cassette domain-containing protein [Legionella pneumophila subsp. pneumophila]CZI09385.1 Lipoprotein-releasing system ATP-binding protein LolD [Legionella pneumophila]CZI39506.1 Lipoprotein-releasing system ATP-binding protein LolD [Legionella pneumophila]HAT9387166.1 ATP-binding cassette domain-containing protein [Legionella pneumophila subsp. pneumophila]HDU7974562.1 ABC transporter ATP-binding protein [L
MSKIVIKTKELSRQLSGEVPVTLVKDINLEVREGEFLVISGPSGSGKSSLLYLLGMLDRPSQGKIWLNNEDVSTYEEEKMAWLRLTQIGYVFQFHFLLPEFTALENVMLPMQRLGKLSLGEMKNRATKLLTSLGLEEQLSKLPKQLSGGQSQRVAIARALANDPILLLADEPTGNLDTVSSTNVQNILKELAHEYRRSVIIVTHDMNFAATADRVIHIVDGKMQE